MADLWGKTKEGLMKTSLISAPSIFWPDHRNTPKAYNMLLSLIGRFDNFLQILAFGYRNE